MAVRFLSETAEAGAGQQAAGVRFLSGTQGGGATGGVRFTGGLSQAGIDTLNAAGLNRDGSLTREAFIEDRDNRSLWDSFTGGLGEMWSMATGLITGKDIGGFYQGASEQELTDNAGEVIGITAAAGTEAVATALEDWWRIGKGIATSPHWLAIKAGEWLPGGAGDYFEELDDDRAYGQYQQDYRRATEGKSKVGSILGALGASDEFRKRIDATLSHRLIQTASIVGDPLNFVPFVAAAKAPALAAKIGALGSKVAGGTMRSIAKPTLAAVLGAERTTKFAGAARNAGAATLRGGHSFLESPSAALMGRIGRGVERLGGAGEKGTDALRLGLQSERGQKIARYGTYAAGAYLGSKAYDESPVLGAIGGVFLGGFGLRLARGGRIGVHTARGGAVVEEAVEDAAGLAQRIQQAGRVIIETGRGVRHGGDAAAFRRIANEQPGAVGKWLANPVYRRLTVPILRLGDDAIREMAFDGVLGFAATGTLEGAAEEAGGSLIIGPGAGAAFRGFERGRAQVGRASLRKSAEAKVNAGQRVNFAEIAAMRGDTQNTARQRVVEDWMQALPAVDAARLEGMPLQDAYAMVETLGMANAMGANGAMVFRVGDNAQIADMQMAHEFGEAWEKYQNAQELGDHKKGSKYTRLAEIKLDQEKLDRTGATEFTGEEMEARRAEMLKEKKAGMYVTEMLDAESGAVRPTAFINAEAARSKPRVTAHEIMHAVVEAELAGGERTRFHELRDLFYDDWDATLGKAIEAGMKGATETELLAAKQHAYDETLAEAFANLTEKAALSDAGIEGTLRAIAKRNQGVLRAVEGGTLERMEANLRLVQLDYLGRIRDAAELMGAKLNDAGDFVDQHGNIVAPSRFDPKTGEAVTQAGVPLPGFSAEGAGVKGPDGQPFGGSALLEAMLADVIVAHSKIIDGFNATPEGGGAPIAGAAPKTRGKIEGAGRFIAKQDYLHREEFIKRNAHFFHRDDAGEVTLDPVTGLPRLLSQRLMDAQGREIGKKVAAAILGVSDEARLAEITEHARNGESFVIGLDQGYLRENEIEALRGLVDGGDLPRQVFDRIVEFTNLARRKDGTPIIIDYAAANRSGRKVAHESVQLERRAGVPFSFTVDRNGNFHIKTLDLTHLQPAINREAKRGSKSKFLRPFDGDALAFTRALIAMANHSVDGGRALDTPGLSMDQKNAVDAFVGIQPRSEDGPSINPVKRPQGWTRAKRIIRDRRVDRIMDMWTEPAGVRIPFRYPGWNFSTDVGGKTITVSPEMEAMKQTNVIDFFDATVGETTPGHMRNDITPANVQHGFISPFKLYPSEPFRWEDMENINKDWEDPNPGRPVLIDTHITSKQYSPSVVDGHHRTRTAQLNKRYVPFVYRIEELAKMWKSLHPEEKRTVNELTDAYNNALDDRAKKMHPVLFSTDTGLPGTHSAARRATDGIQQKTMTVAQARAALGKQRGALAEAKENPQLAELLGRNDNEKVSREDLAQAAEEGAVRLEETKREFEDDAPPTQDDIEQQTQVRLNEIDEPEFELPFPEYKVERQEDTDGTIEYRVREPDGTAFEYFDTEEEAQDYADEEAERAIEEMRDNAVEEWRREQYSDIFAELEREAEDEYGDDDNSFRQYAYADGENYTETLVRLPPEGAHVEKGPDKESPWVVYHGSKKWNAFADKGIAEDHAIRLSRIPQNPFVSRHWDEPNVLLHIRAQELYATTGERLMVIEELQSDWHQAGREKGYADQEETIEVERSGEDWEAKWNGKEIGLVVGATRAEAIDAARKKAKEIGLDKIGVPPAPFRNTNEWAALGIKRALADAVDRGVDRMAWTQGKEHADRYNLAKQVDEIDASVYAGTWAINGTKDGEQIFNTDAAERELPGIVGKDLAAKIIADGGGTYSGDDLRVGGHGMIAFYDRLLPNVAKDIVRRIDKKAKITPVKFEAKGAEGGVKTQEALSVPITDKVRAAVENGDLPLFSSDTATGDGAATSAADATPKFTGKITGRKTEIPWTYRSRNEFMLNVTTGQLQNAINRFQRFGIDELASDEINALAWIDFWTQKTDAASSLPTRALTATLERWKPKEPVKLYRAHNDYFDGENYPMMAWTYDRDLAIYYTAGGEKSLVSGILKPEDIIVDTTLIPHAEEINKQNEIIAYSDADIQDYTTYDVQYSNDTAMPKMPNAAHQGRVFGEATNPTGGPPLLARSAGRFSTDIDPLFGGGGAMSNDLSSAIDALMGGAPEVPKTIKKPKAQNADAVKAGQTWRIVAEQDEAFQYARQITGTTAEEIAAQVSTEERPVIGQHFKSSYGESVSFQRGPDGNELLLAKGLLSNGKWQIDASDLEKGDGGSQLYQAAYAYAHNNGIQVQVSKSLSEVNETRILANMASSALRHGTTRHLIPNPESQPNLQALWVDGNDTNNIGALLSLEAEHVKSTLDNWGESWYYDIDARAVVNKDGEQISKDKILDVIRGHDPTFEQGIGPGTLARGLYTEQVLRRTKDHGRRHGGRLLEHHGIRNLSDAAPNRPLYSADVWNAGPLHETMRDLGIRIVSPNEFKRRLRVRPEFHRAKGERGRAKGGKNKEDLLNDEVSNNYGLELEHMQGTLNHLWTTSEDAGMPDQVAMEVLGGLGRDTQSMSGPEFMEALAAEAMNAREGRTNAGADNAAAIADDHYSEQEAAMLRQEVERAQSFANDALEPHPGARYAGSAEHLGFLAEGDEIVIGGGESVRVIGPEDAGLRVDGGDLYGEQVIPWGDDVYVVDIRSDERPGRADAALRAMSELGDNPLREAARLEELKAEQERASEHEARVEELLEQIETLRKDLLGERQGAQAARGEANEAGVLRRAAQQQREGVREQLRIERGKHTRATGRLRHQAGQVRARDRIIADLEGQIASLRRQGASPKKAAEARRRIPSDVRARRPSAAVRAILANTKLPPAARLDLMLLIIAGKDIEVESDLPDARKGVRNAQAAEQRRQRQQAGGVN